MKIAVCDDSREDRDTRQALLEACGHDFEIREYGSGAELYADMGYVRECGIVFLDINMEGMDGLEAAGRIKAECPKVHIVLVSAYVNYALDGYKVEASRFLLKDDLEQTLPKSRYPEVKRQYTLFKGAERLWGGGYFHSVSWR